MENLYQVVSHLDEPKRYISLTIDELCIVILGLMLLTTSNHKLLVGILSLVIYSFLKYLKARPWTKIFINPNLLAHARYACEVNCTQTSKIILQTMARLNMRIGEHSISRLSVRFNLMVFLVFGLLATDILLFIRPHN